jgi:hypothetical protein
MLGPYRPKAVPVDEAIGAVVRDACIAAAHPVYSVGLTDQPLVVADARGLGLVTAVLADETAAFECRARLSDDGTAAEVLLPPARLDPGRTAQPTGSDISLVTQTIEEDDGAGVARTIAIGRIGPEAFAVGTVFNDETETVAAVANGWFASWWNPAKSVGGTVSANSRNEVQDSVEHPADLVEGRVTAAIWWVDPSALPLGPSTTAVQAHLIEAACASGKSPKGRVRAPTVVVTDDAMTVTVWVTRRSGGQDCPGNPEFGFKLTLPEELGARKLLDGGGSLPRDATVRPPR